MPDTATVYHELIAKLDSRGRLKAEPPLELDITELKLADGFLPNELETTYTTHLIREGYVEPVALLNQPSLPIRGKISTRGGYALKRTGIPPLLDRFLEVSQAHTIFVVQGGNRHITRYIGNRERALPRDIKLMCASKARLAEILCTVLDTEDLLSHLHTSQIAGILAAVSNMPGDQSEILKQKYKGFIGKELTASSLREQQLFRLLQLFCDATIPTPFAYPTDDSKLFEEFNAMHDAIEQDTIEIANLDIVRLLLEHTGLKQLLQQDDQIVFIDDLFYRGRTLFTIACILKAFGINPRKARLYTLCADRVSHNLRSDYITVLNNDVLYPFENSIRTERGYWQRAHGRFIFSDMEKFWQYLAVVVDRHTSMETYESWQALLEELWLKLPPNRLTKKMTYALIWYLVFHKAYGLPIDLASLTDQRGEGIGYCVPYARIIDNFISQEEPVEKRSAFKDDIRKAVEDIWNLDEKDGTAFNGLVTYYRSHANAIDYEGLGFMFDIYDYGL